ncbi:uncharacterized protein KGF55_005404 [Candida pseudojiufengensis]|uniref:uncharacterized protein n=1 Tax=Candida pseudojiufengensis TaxID=497109 RepID=UPI002223FDB8|nr:uncharacterized protein KGF55_005404 [Candida pseudojiufengensis]KAI5959426.1 hypothetical protein KGF55_005404 [Candida pseudojiufengensis]
MSEDAGTHHNDRVVLKISKLLEIKLSQLRYFTFLIIGIALLWPWNCFLSASAYYGTRFINSPSLVKIYSSTMMSVSTITSAIFNYYLSQQQTGVNYSNRVKLGFNLTIIIFIFMAITCITQIFINMNDSFFFSILMIMVLLSAGATCLAQNGTMAIVNVMGSIYANSVMVGQAVAGVLPSCALIISILAVGEKTLENHKIEKDFGVFVYYITASLVCMLSISLLYLIDERKEHAIYERLDELMEEEHTTTELGDGEEEYETVTQKNFVSFSDLWSKLNLIVMTIFLTFSITLIFPVFASIVESVNDESEFKFFNKQIFIPFIYLIWNLGDLLGRILCGYPKLKMLITNPKVLIIYSVSRIVFIPLFFTCNVKPGVSNPLVNSDLWYILLQLLFGISNGQLCTSSFMIVGKFCDNDDEKEAAGGFTTVFLSFGLMAGSVFSYLLVLYLN